MSAVPSTLAAAQDTAIREAQFVPLTAAWLDAVMQLENAAYPHPWTRGNFTDSLNAGYQAQLLWAEPDVLLGCFVP